MEALLVTGKFIAVTQLLSEASTEVFFYILLIRYLHCFCYNNYINFVSYNYLFHTTFTRLLRVSFFFF